MFEYDRLALDITQQFFTSSPPTQQRFYHDHQNNCSGIEKSLGDQKHKAAFLNAISQPSKSNQMPTDAELINKRSPIAINGLFNGYCQYIRNQNQKIFSPKSVDSGDDNTRRLSGGSNSYNDCIFDCGASSGYGSPGVAGTPLASPAPNSAHYIAHQLQKMLDQEFCETIINPNKNQCSLTLESVSLSHPSLKSSNVLTQQVSTLHATNLPISSTAQRDLSVIESIRYNLDEDFAWKKLCFDDDGDDFFDQQTITAGVHYLPDFDDKMFCNIDVQKNDFLSRDFAPSPTLTTSSTPATTTSSAAAAAAAVEDGFSATEIAQFAQLLCSPKKAPPQRYQCHICYQTGHYISDCPMRFNSPYEELTPYQGRKKCYGEFQCQLCKRKWTSQNSVANEAQSCIKCHVPVFPHKQLPVDKAIALGLVKSQRVLPTKITPIGHGRPPTTTGQDECDALVNNNEKTFLSSSMFDKVLKC